jgi:Zn-dependent M28 family amino/carboxypeptidase
MEAARILSTLQVKPKRTIRFALWSGEEQGIYGSLNYVERRMAERGPPGDTDPWRRQYGVWEQKYPIRPKPGLRDLAAYFNLDGGSGKIRGIYAENNAGVVSIFREWFAPFTSMGASTVAIQKTGASDHYYMQALGAPAFQFIQDPLDYHSRLHHTGIDTYEHLRPDDLRQAAVIVASFLLFASNRDEPLPAAPLPAPPRPTDPFDHPVAEED